MMFGFAKPVPVNFARLRRPRRDMVLVAAAGPGINLAMALTAASGPRIPAQPGDALEWIGYNLFNAVWINVLLAVFNMLPLPPLDGGRVAVGLLPDVLARPLSRLEPYGFHHPWLALRSAASGGVLGIDIGIVQWLVIAPPSG